MEGFFTQSSEIPNFCGSAFCLCCSFPFPLQNSQPPRLHTNLPRCSEIAASFQQFPSISSLPAPRHPILRESLLLRSARRRRRRRRRQETRTDLMADEAAAHEASPPPPASEDRKALRSFLDFMTKVTQYEELVDAGKRFLLKFHQELEHFRRPKLPMESGAVSELVKSNYTDRMKSYLEAGCNLQHQSIRNINQLHSCEEKLGDHINKAKDLLEELQCLVEDVYSITLTASLSVLTASDGFHGDDNLTNDCCEDEQQPGDQLDSTVSYASVMILVHNMLKLDYTMQEKIVKALCLKTSSSELEGYCLMWDLRPYVDDNVMQLAWNFVP